MPAEGSPVFTELQHPDADALAAFALGKLPDTQLAAVAAHLDACPACARRVKEQSADAFADKLRRPDKRSTASGNGSSLTGLSQVVRAFDDLDAPAAVPPELAALTQYADLKELGRGGMGVVYVARNILMDRTEVLKVASRGALERGDPGAAERFLREIRAAAMLSHPNVVAAYTAIPAGDLLVFAMEYAAGEDLSKVVKRKGPLPVAVACYYAHCAALGLQHAHENGMVHRDIKPGNLILTRVNGKTVVKVLDFGLAKVPASATDLTGTGKLMGTPDYIAPEQAMDAARADIRADVYSLGCTLYCLLAGKPPFGGAGTWLAVVDAHRNRQPKPLDVVRPEVPAELAAVVAKMLAKNPADRFQTPGEAAAAVRPFIVKKAKAATVVGETVRPEPTAPAAPRLRLVAKPARRWPRLAGLAAVALLAAVAAGALRVRTADGTLVVENVPAGAEVLVDGETVTLTRDGETVTLSARPGPHRLRVVQGGKELLAKDEVVVTVGGEPVRVRVEPPAPPLPETPPAEPFAPVGTVWAGTYVTTEPDGRTRLGGSTFTVTERTGQSLKLRWRSGAGGETVADGTVDAAGRFRLDGVLQLMPQSKPRVERKGSGEFSGSRFTLAWEGGEAGQTLRGDWKRLPDGGDGFRFTGRWKCFDLPSGWNGIRPVHADGTLDQGRDRHRWTRDGGLIQISFGQWLVIDPDNPNVLKGGGGNLTVTWVRQ